MLGKVLKNYGKVEKEGGGGVSMTSDYIKYVISLAVR